MAGINLKRVIVGGLVAGLVMNVISFVINGIVLAERYAAMGKAGHLLTEPRLLFMPLYLVFLFAEGIVLAFLYAAARPRFGPGPRTALLVGLAVAFPAAFLPNYTQAAWSAVGRFIPLMWMIDSGLACVAGTLVAGALYREEPEAKP